MSLSRLSPSQRGLVSAWLPECRVVADLSWRDGSTTVLHVCSGGAEYIVKAGGPADHHIGRELDAHGFDGGVDRVAAWRRDESAARLVHADRARRVLVLSYLPGRLAYRTSAGTDPEIHRRAGGLLRRFHDQASVVDAGADAAATRRTLQWLDGPHAIAPEVEARIREALRSAEASEPPLVPTHGDWQPRNWLVDRDRVRVIDLGRFAMRSADTDFARLAAQEWLDSPECAVAFFEGYGGDPREPAHWRLVQLREAVATAAWARKVGNSDFEAQGHRMIAAALEAAPA